MVEIRNHHMGIDRQLGLEGGGQGEQDGTNGTHIEDMKGPVEVQFPSSDHFLIVLCMKQPGGYVPPAPFDDLALNLGYSPAMKSVVSRPSEPCIGSLTHIFN